MSSKILNQNDFKLGFPSFLLLLLCLSLTAVVFVLSKNAISEKARSKFDNEWKGVQAKIQTEAEVYLDALFAGRGLFAASQSVERNEWKDFIENQRLINRLPGIVAREYIQVVKSEELTEFVQSVRGDKSVGPRGYPNFDIHPKSSNKNHYIINYVEPFETNLKAFGYDMAAVDVRRVALEQAIATGKPYATGKIQLARNESEVGFVMMLPIYKKGFPTSSPAERQAAIQGLIASVINAADFFGSSMIQSKETAQIDFEIFDSRSMTQQSVIFDFDNALHAVDKHYKARFSVDVPIQVAERTFVMHYTAPQNFGLGEGQEFIPYWVLGIGTILSFLLFFVVRTLAYSEAKARQYANEKTREIKLLLDSSADGIYGINLQGECTFINLAALEMLGYQSDEVIGKNIHQLAHYKKPDGQPYPIEHCPIYKAFKSGTCCRVKDEALWRKDEKSFPVEYSASPIMEGGNILGALCAFRDITASKKTEEILKQKQAELLDFFENSNVCMHWVGADGTILWANKTEIELLGYSENEYIGQNISKFHADEPVISDILRRLTRCEKLNQYEARLRAKDGSIKIVAINSSAYVRDGKFIHTRCFTQDITEKKMREEEAARLTAVQARFFAIVESSDDAIVSKDLNGIIMSWNKAAERIFGYTEKEAVGRPMAMLIPVDRQPEEPEILAKIAHDERIEHFETVRMTKNGKPIYVSVTLSPMKDANGKIIGASKIVRDITERKETESKLIKASAEIERGRLQLQAVLDSATEVSIISTDTAGVIRLFNRGSERMLGWKSEAMVGLKTPEVIHDLQEVLERGKEMSRIAGKPIEGFEVFVADAREGRPELREWTYVRKDGSRFPVSLYVTAVYNAKQEVTGFLGVATDITKIKAAEINANESAQKARDASRAKSDFLATMSHEIRTPMNAILGMAELLNETNLSKEQKDYVDRLGRGGETLLSIINDVLDISKIEAGSMEIENIDFDFFNQASQAVDLLALKAHQKGLDINLKIDPAIPTMLRADSMRLRQILINLINNAIKFTAKGEINVTVTSEKGFPEMLASKVMLHFIVSDTGIGIPKSKIENLFEPFMQADTSTTRKYGGTGLGLNISKRFVELMGGKIWVDSKEGEGSQFHFMIPFEVSATQALGRPEEANIFMNKKMLVVDDNETNRLILLHHLKEWGVIADEAESAVEALRKIEASKNKPYDLMILDCRMPGMGGFELAQKLKSEQNIHVPMIVMLTSDNRAGDRERAHQIGFVSYLVKPVKKEALRESLGKTFEPSGRTGASPQKLLDQATVISPESAATLRILLADDSEDNQNLIQAYLKKYPYQIDLANNGKEVCEKAARGECDVILMDIQMPEMDGYTATRFIREQEAANASKRHVPIIALTANALSEDIQKCLDAGCDYYLSKPVKKNVLLEMLQTATALKKV